METLTKVVGTAFVIPLLLAALETATYIASRLVAICFAVTIVAAIWNR